MCLLCALACTGWFGEGTCANCVTELFVHGLTVLQISKFSDTVVKNILTLRTRWLEVLKYVMGLYMPGYIYIYIYTPLRNDFGCISSLWWGKRCVFYVIHSSLNVMLFRSFRMTALWQALLPVKHSVLHRVCKERCKQVLCCIST